LELLKVILGNQKILVVLDVPNMSDISNFLKSRKSNIVGFGSKDDNVLAHREDFTFEVSFPAAGVPDDYDVFALLPDVSHI
jgi:hypothetical protein